MVLAWRTAGDRITPEEMLEYFDTHLRAAQVEEQVQGVVKVADPQAMPQLPHRLRFQLLEESAEDWYFTEEELETPSLEEDRQVALEGEIHLTNERIPITHPHHTPLGDFFVMHLGPQGSKQILLELVVGALEDSVRIQVGIAGDENPISVINMPLAPMYEAEGEFQDTLDEAAQISEGNVIKLRQPEDEI